MTKKTLTRMENIKKHAHISKPQIAGVCDEIEGRIKRGHHPLTIARALGVSVEYVGKVREAMARRVQ